MASMNLSPFDEEIKRPINKSNFTNTERIVRNFDDVKTYQDFVNMIRESSRDFTPTNVPEYTDETMLAFQNALIQSQNDPLVKVNTLFIVLLDERQSSVANKESPNQFIMNFMFHPRSIIHLSDDTWHQFIDALIWTRNVHNAFEYIAYRVNDEQMHQLLTHFVRGFLTSYLSRKSCQQYLLEKSSDMNLSPQTQMFFQSLHHFTTHII